VIAPWRISIAVGAALLCACGTAGVQSSSPSKTELRVFAAASLTQSFQRLGSAFAAANPQYSPRFIFGGSATLAQQIIDGAPADVFASADNTNMQKVVSNGLVSGTAATFASNVLEIAVAKGNPKHIRGLSELARKDIVTVLCAVQVPCGKYAQQSLAHAHVTVHPSSLETDVKSVLRKVSLGEADAGIVYVTDVRAAGSSVTGVSIAAADNVIAKYPIAELKSGHTTAAAAFIRFVLGQEGQSILEADGFGKP